MTLNGPEKRVYERRRSRVLDQLDGSGAVLFIPGAPESVYSNDVHYRYRPATNVRYLSGFEEPCALLLRRCGNDGDGFTLFVRPRDEAAETWTGRRAGVDGARADYGADHAYPMEEMFTVLEERLRDASRLYYVHSRDRSVNERTSDIVRRVDSQRPRSGRAPLLLTDAGSVLDEMRLIKEDEEIELMRKACAISAAAHGRAMETLVPGMHEYQVEGIVEHAFRDAGCSGPAYGTIAAAGDNATVLHYTRNDKIVRDHELLLLDAGGEYGGYCADITRTMPSDARYSPSQAALYDVVLNAQLRAIEVVSPGSTYDSVHRTAVRALVEGMIDVGMLQGGVDECIESEAYRTYYMHNTSHWLGMDVHDVGSYRDGDASRSLEPGMVLTVEPGIYVRPDADAPKEFRGIGIRIEDDVLVTTNGREVLTSDAPKQRSEVESLRVRAGRSST